MKLMITGASKLTEIGIFDAAFFSYYYLYGSTNESMNDGVYFNTFSPSSNWDKSRKFCMDKGGDLAVYTISKERYGNNVIELISRIVTLYVAVTFHQCS